MAHNSIDVKKAIEDFNNNALTEIQEEETELEKIRKSFVGDFNLKKIKTMTIDEYVMGTGNQNGFCYRLEKQLAGLGQMPPYSGSTRYGIWVDRQEYLNGNVVYHIQSEFGTERDVQRAFENVRKAIKELIEAGEIGDRQAIYNSPLQANFKYKLLYTYFPKKYHNICALNHASVALYTLGISFPDNYELLEMTDELDRWKGKNPETQEWTNYILMRFLYDKLRIKDNMTDEFNAAKNPKARADAYAHKSVVEARQIVREQNEESKIAIQKKIKENAKKLTIGEIHNHKTWGKIEIVEILDNKMKIKILSNGDIKIISTASFFDFVA